MLLKSIAVQSEDWGALILRLAKSLRNSRPSKEELEDQAIKAFKGSSISSYQKAMVAMDICDVVAELYSEAVSGTGEYPLHADESLTIAQMLITSIDPEDKTSDTNDSFGTAERLISIVAGSAEHIESLKAREIPAVSLEPQLRADRLEQYAQALRASAYRLQLLSDCENCAKSRLELADKCEAWSKSLRPSSQDTGNLITFEAFTKSKPKTGTT